MRNLLQLRAALRRDAAARARGEQARAALAARFDLRGVVYASGAMHAVVQMATQVARADVPVLITGPNGAGKEVIAEIIQANSSVRGGPVRARQRRRAARRSCSRASCSARRPGAYTGAKARAGRFEAADGGTLFLDEIGNLSLAGQAKLLRVLQTGEFERLGSTQTRRVTVRVLSATNTPLAEAIREGRFREDLYYRLNVIEIQVPPLAERRDDILPLARAFPRGRVRVRRRGRARCWRATPGPATSASWRTACGAPACCPSDRVIRPQHLMLPAARRRNRRCASPIAARSSSRSRAPAASSRARRATSGLSRQSLYRRMEKLGIASDEPGGQ